jgi:hypothetical protein
LILCDGIDVEVVLVGLIKDFPFIVCRRSANADLGIVFGSDLLNMDDFLGDGRLLGGNGMVFEVCLSACNGSLMMGSSNALGCKSSFGSVVPIDKFSEEALDEPEMEFLLG